MRSWFRVVLVNAASILAVVVLAEAIFGTWLGDSFGALNIPRETIRFDAGDLYAGGKDVIYKRDRYGLRGTYSSPSEIDILTIGGSTTDQKALTEGETWQDVLSAAFKAAGREVSVVNAGIDGQSTIGHLFNFERWFPLIPGLRARYVIVYVGINDVYVWMKDTSDRLLAESRLLRIHHAIKNNSALYKLYRILKGMLIARKARLSGGRMDYGNAVWTDTPSDPAFIQMTDRVRSYRIRLKKLVRRIRTFGAKPILVTQRRGDARRDDTGRLWGVAAPGNRRNGLDEALALNEINRATLATCAELGVICFDLATEIDLDQSDFYDRVHTNPKGARKIGLYLYGKMKGLKGLAK